MYVFWLLLTETMLPSLFTKSQKKPNFWENYNYLMYVMLFVVLFIKEAADFYAINCIILNNIMYTKYCTLLII